MAGYELKSDVAKQITKLSFKGDIIPHSWYQHIRKSDKKTKQGDKPYLLAIMILANIIYWYRLEEVRDESTNLIIGYRQKFKYKMLQKVIKTMHNNMVLVRGQLSVLSIT